MMEAREAEKIFANMRRNPVKIVKYELDEDKFTPPFMASDNDLYPAPNYSSKDAGTSPEDKKDYWDDQMK